MFWFGFGLEVLDASNFFEPTFAKGEVEHVAAASEAVLLSLQDAAAFEVLVFLFDREVHHRIDHMLKLIGTSHLTSLIHLVDAHADCAGVLTEVSDLLQAADGSTGGDLTRGVLIVIQAL